MKHEIVEFLRKRDRNRKSWEQILFRQPDKCGGLCNKEIGETKRWVIF